MSNYSITPPSPLASVETWRTYLLKLSGMDMEDTSVKIAIKSARDIINLKSDMPAMFSTARA